MPRKPLQIHTSPGAARRELRSLLHRAPLLVALTLSAWPGAAAAQPDMSRALSRTAFEDGMRLSKAGAYAAACLKLEESLRLDPQMGTRFWLADCYEHVGRSASAWSSFLAVAADARGAGNSAREATARARADALAPSVPRLVLVVPESLRATPGLEIRRDGAVIAPAGWSVPMPVDPGDHQLRASAPGKETWERTLTVGPTGAQVEIPQLQEMGPAPSLPQPGAPPRPPPPETRTPEPARSAPPLAPPPAPPAVDPWRRPFVVSAGSVGGLLLVGGAVTGGLALSTWHQALGLCNAGATACSSDAQSKKSTATTLATLSDVGLAVGAAAAAAAIIVQITTPRGPKTSTAPAVRLALGPGALRLGGEFP